MKSSEQRKFRVDQKSRQREGPEEEEECEAASGGAAAPPLLPCRLQELATQAGFYQAAGRNQKEERKQK